jgi:hypothetical protein
MNRQAKILIGLPLVVILGFGVAHMYKIIMYSTWFEGVSLQDSEQSVQRKMGTPDQVNTGPHMWCKELGTVREFMYGASFPPEWRVVGFDGQGRVICKVHLQSP